MKFTCTTSQHAFFTQGKTYEGIKGTFGWLVKDDNGASRHVGSVGCFQTRLSVNVFTTKFAQG